MRSGIRRIISPWIDTARGVGFFIFLVAGSAGLGFMIAWPLWLLATRESRLYTILVLTLLAAGIIFLTVRGAVRRRNEQHDPGKTRRTPLSILLTFLMALSACSGAYAVSVFVFRGLWTFTLIAVPIWVCVLWLLARARRAVKEYAAKSRKEPLPPAENMGE